MKVGIQLFSVKNNMAKDPLATIRQVIAMGYRYLEGANHGAGQDNGIGFGVKAEDLKKLLDETGASIISCHLAPLSMDNIDAVIEYQQAIGTKYIVDPACFYATKDDVLRKAEDFNKIGEKCKAAGMEFLFHNHFHEFQRFGDETAFDILMDNTQPDLMGVELDTYWVMRAGVDPVDVMKKQGKRVKLVHQKDFTKGYEAVANILATVEKEGGTIDMNRFMQYVDVNTFTEIGTGTMEIQKIIDAANQYCQSEFIILEQDATKLDELESLRVSMENFKAYSGINW